LVKTRSSYVASLARPGGNHSPSLARKSGQRGETAIENYGTAGRNKTHERWSVDRI
jgi:hypothetical protein